MPNLHGGRGGRGGRGGLAAPPLLQPPLPLGQLSAAASFLDSVASLAPQQAPPQRPAAARRPPLPQGGGYGGGGYGGQSAPQQAPPPRSAAGRPQPAAATAASPGSDLLAAFSQTRQQLLSGKNSYLDYCQLHNLLQQKQKHRPKEVGEAMHALQRVLAAVNTAVAAALGTHNLLTLADLERLVLAGSRDFEGVGSFEQLKLGPLRCHPLVQRHFPKAALTAAAAEGKSVDLSVGEVMQALAAGVDANWSDDPNAERKPFSMQDALQVLAQSKGLASADELPLFMRGSSHFVTGMLVRFTAARHKAETKADQLVAKERQKVIERGKQQGAAAAMKLLEEEARDKEQARRLALKAAAVAVEDLAVSEGTATTGESQLLKTVQAVVREAQARGLPAKELVEAQLKASWLKQLANEVRAFLASGLEPRLTSLPAHLSGAIEPALLHLIGRHIDGAVAPLMLAAVERLAAGREELQADLLAEGADILAQLGSSAVAGAGAPPVRTAEALLDHIRSLHADAVADGADASPLVLLATIEQRLHSSMSRSGHPALSAVGYGLQTLHAESRPCCVTGCATCHTAPSRSCGSSRAPSSPSWVPMPTRSLTCCPLVSPQRRRVVCRPPLPSWATQRRRGPNVSTRLTMRAGLCWPRRRYSALPRPRCGPTSLSRAWAAWPPSCRAGRSCSCWRCREAPWCGCRGAASKSSSRPSIA
jgi:hypothetical protein